MGASVVLAVLPLAFTLVAFLVASAAGCALDESGIHPCVIGGVDWGGLLAFMGMMFWLSFVSIPAGAVGLFVGAVLYAIGRWARKA